MPHLRFRAVEEPMVQKLSDLLPEPLSFVLGCPADYFSFEWIPSRYYFSGESVLGIPTVEIIWFDRGQDQQDLVAQMVHERMIEMGCEETTIIFTNVTEGAYYDNGQHY